MLDLNEDDECGRKLYRTVGELIAKLKEYDEKAEVFGWWEGLTPPIKGVYEKEGSVYLYVDNW